MRSITIANQKGGCGKTTVAINLAASLAREGRRILLVDLDAQAHCALGMAVPEEQIDLSIVDCLMGELEGEPVDLSRITWQIAPNLDLAPSRFNLSTLEQRLGTGPGADKLLANLLKRNAERYDYAVIDCAPHVGPLMKNGLRVADEVIIPVDTGYFSLHGLTQQFALVEQLAADYETKPTVRVLANQYDVRTKLAREILAELRNRFKDFVFETIINFNTKLKEGASYGQPITEFAPSSMGAQDFQKLARELIVSEPEKTATPELLQHMEKLAADAERLLATTATLVENPLTDRSGGQVLDLTSVRPADVAAATRAASMPSMTRAPSPAKPSIIPPTAPGTIEAPVGMVGTVPAGLASDPATHFPDLPRSFVPHTPTAPVPSPVHDLPGSASQIAETTGESSKQQDAPLETDPGDTSALNGENTETTVQPETSGLHQDIEQRIAAVYGVHQEGDVAVFCSRCPEASEVQVAGDFNDWMPHTTPMRRLATGDFEARLRLPKGRYRYRLVIDGRWSHDPHNPAIETNEYGELNSVIEVTT